MYLIIIVIIVLIALIPIPIKVYLLYFDGKYSVFIYGKKLKFTVRRTERKIKYNFNTLKYISKHRHKFLKYSSKIKLTVGIGLEDAAHTALSFGIVNSLGAAFYNLLNVFFNVRDYNYKVIPFFKKNIFKIEFESIFWISIAKTIYNLFILIFVLMKLRMKILIRKIKNKGSVHYG
ncbi:membrane protein [Clostridium acetobutylicum]|nr:membrane protein [Clostridium acetobutylicum]